MKNKNNPFFYYYTKSSITNKKEKIWVIDPGPVSNVHLAYCWEKVKDEIEKQEKIQDIQNKYNNLKKELKIQKSKEKIKNKQKI